MINIGNNSIENILVGDTLVDRVYLGIDIVWEKLATVKNYLKFTALESGTFTLTIPANVTTSSLASISYSIDNGATWVTTQNSSSAVTVTTPTVVQGGTVLWKGDGTAMAVSNTAGNYSNFSSTGNFGVSGNVMSLLYQNTFETEYTLTQSYAFYGLFSNCNTLIATEMELPATTITNSCYRDLFSTCEYLTEARFDLPAPVAEESSYRSMFGHCSRLVTADITIYAQTLSLYSCAYLCFQCVELTTAPVILSRTLTTASLNSTFSGCKKLHYIKIMCISPLSSTNSANITDGAASTGTFVKNSEATWDQRGKHGIPSGWTVVDAND